MLDLSGGPGHSQRPEGQTSALSQRLTPGALRLNRMHSLRRGIVYLLGRLSTVQVSSQHTKNCEQIRLNFEHREAIYIEGGALRVRVSDIQANVATRSVTARIEEIPTPGLGTGAFRRYRSPESELLGWEIGAGYLTTFADDRWIMGYGGWSLYFASLVVDGVVDLASQWPETLEDADRYAEVGRLLMDNRPYGPSRRAFPE